MIISTEAFKIDLHKKHSSKTLLEEYDLSGKKIIPFVTSGGSGFSDSISEIQKLQPEAEVETDGFKATHSKIDDVTPEDVGEWIAGLNL